MKTSRILPSFLALALWLAFPLSAGTSTPPPEEIQKAINLFFNLLKENKIDQAYDVILSNAPNIKERKEEVEGLKKQTREAIKTYGAILGHEVIEQKRVGMSLIQMVCLSRSENFPLRWRFSYYRPSEKWKLLDIFVDDKIGELFDPSPSGEKKEGERDGERRARP